MVLLLALFVFACAVFTTEVIGHDAEDTFAYTVPGTDELAKDFFPDVAMSMYTLFYCLGEGCSDKVVIPIIRVEPRLGWFFLLFFCMTTYCFLNLIMGVFVENTLSLAQADAHKQLRNKERQ